MLISVRVLLTGQLARGSTAGLLRMERHRFKSQPMLNICITTVYLLL